MRFSHAFSFFIWCFPFALMATHSEKERWSDVLNKNFQLQTPKSLTLLSSPAQAPTFLPLKKDRSRKEREELRRNLRAVTKGKNLKHLSEEELRRCADLSIALLDYDEALNFLHKLEKKTKNTTVVKNVKLEIADITFESGNLKGAAKLYDEYIGLYPGDKVKAAYAKYKAILGNFYCMLKKDRDQTITHKIISLADAFLENPSSMFKKYAYDVQSIKFHCFTRLYEHDKVVFDFYLKKGSLKAAENRLGSMRKSLLAKRPDLEPQFLECELRLAQSQKDTPRVLRVSQELSKRFPDEVRVAQAKKTPLNYVTRF